MSQSECTVAPAEQKTAESTPDYLPTDYQKFIHMSKYARWLDSEGRRETWPETVNRYCRFMMAHLHEKTAYGPTQEEMNEVQNAILNLEVMPSMRAMMTAGKALELDNVAGYNCAYTQIDSPHKFSEMLYVLMCGTGVGFSVERQFITRLPVVPRTLAQDVKMEDRPLIIVQDSKIGWATALRELIDYLYAGRVPRWDTSLVRPAGVRLKTFGGRASGPKPLSELFAYIVAKFKGAVPADQWDDERKLTSLELHHICCKIAEIVVVGGVRRAALLSLSNLSDDRMRSAKSGRWWKESPELALANNSACYTEKPEIGCFMREWVSLHQSMSGERGMFNRVACRAHVSKNCPGRKYEGQDFGCNPCSEIILRSNEFCNLSEVIVRANDTPASLKRKVRIATIIGTWQATLTDFRFLSPDWKANCEEERLLGVSLTGIMDNSFMSGQCERKEDSFYERAAKRRMVLRSDNSFDGLTLPGFLEELKQIAVSTNEDWARRHGINPSAAITCVKPSGTVSQLVNSASGIHPRHARNYIRTVRGDAKDPLTRFMRDLGIPCEPCANTKEGESPNTYVFSFPINSPDSCITRHNLTAIEHLDLSHVYDMHWCQHKVSVTISVRRDEWMAVGAWVWEHFNEIAGKSFLPFNDSDHIYKQAPYQECDRATCDELASRSPSKIPWKRLQKYESDDQTTGSHEYACTANGCEL